MTNLITNVANAESSGSIPGLTKATATDGAEGTGVFAAMLEEAATGDKAASRLKQILLALDPSQTKGKKADNQNLAALLGQLLKNADNIKDVSRLTQGNVKPDADPSDKDKASPADSLPALVNLMLAQVSTEHAQTPAKAQTHAGSTLASVAKEETSPDLVKTQKDVLLKQTSTDQPVSTTPHKPDTLQTGHNLFATQLLQQDGTRQPILAGTHHDQTNPSLLTSLNSVQHTLSPRLLASMQASTQTAAQTGALQASLQAAVGSNPWQEQLGQQLVHMSQQGKQTMQLHLEPRQLGPLQVSLHVDQNQAQAHFFAAHAQVRDAIQQAIPQLREALAGQGIALGEAMVGQQQQQGQQQEQNEAFASSRHSALSPQEDEGDTNLGAMTPVHAAHPLRPVTLNGVDLYA